MISIIVPTYNERENIGLLINKLSKMFEEQKINGEIIIVDDNSPDNTACVARKHENMFDVKVIVRENERGLATAVIKGFEIAKGYVCVVMDADLSHPIETIPKMIKPILDGKCDAVIGSRYISEGGSENWSIVRQLVSKSAGFLAKGITKLSDPTSGFMAIKRMILKDAELDPIGWKIVLEVLVKTNCSFSEIPIIFKDRYKGKSKLGFNTQIKYLQHLQRLYFFKYAEAYKFLKFCIVGSLGFIIDTIILVCLVELIEYDPRLAAIFSFLVAVTFNYFFNKIWTFNIKKNNKVIKRYTLFVLVCVLGLGLRILIMHFLIEYAGMGSGLRYILASFLGILGGTFFNFLGSKYIIFNTFCVGEESEKRLMNY